MGKNKGSRKPYLRKQDSLNREFSAREKKWGMLNLYVLISMAVVASVCFVYLTD